MAISNRPILRWAGSKRKLIPQLLAVVPVNFDRYVEPFAGSACLFFALEPRRAILSDINAGLINTYRAIKNDVEEVVENLKRFKCNRREYYRVRKQSPEKLSRSEQAARFIYLNRFCFNGLFRTNKAGLFNVPYGGEKSGTLPAAEVLRRCSKFLKRASVRAGSFEETLECVRSGDFVYLDPPYAIQSRRVFNEYSNFAFGPTQLTCLRAFLKRLDKANIPFLVSYGVSSEARALAAGFRAKEIVVQRQIAGFAGNRHKCRELLITNY